MARRPQGPPAFATAPASRTKWLIVGLVVALIVATGTAVWAVTRPAEDAPDTASPDPAPTPSSTADDGPADGCLGGQDPTTAVLAAHEDATLTSTGAAAFTGTFLRWMFQIPRPTDDLRTTGELVATAEVVANIDAMTASLEQQNASNPPGTRLRATTLDQRYEVVSLSESDAIVASSIRIVDEGGLQEPIETMLFVQLRVDDGKWQADVAPTDEQLVAAGLPTGTGQDLQSYRQYLFEQGVAYEGGC